MTAAKGVHRIVLQNSLLHANEELSNPTERNFGTTLRTCASFLIAYFSRENSFATQSIGQRTPPDQRAGARADRRAAPNYRRDANPPYCICPRGVFRLRRRTSRTGGHSRKRW